MYCEESVWSDEWDIESNIQRAERQKFGHKRRWGLAEMADGVFRRLVRFTSNSGRSKLKV
jgi:hypothetical protein